MELKEGLINSSEITVTPADTANRFGSGLIEVYATPAMITLMENTSQECVQEYLPFGCITLGTEVNIKHLKATTVGVKVRCEAILKQVVGKKLIFEVNAWDEEGLIGTGVHCRHIVDKERFIKKLKG